MNARKQILPNNSYAHIFFRCHNRQFFLKQNHIKNYLLSLWAKYKKRYGVKIFEFVILDNHCHLLAKASSTEALGHFMRTVNSLLARYINKTLERDSQAIRERYKSPLIAEMKYAHRVMQYIWLNRYKVDSRINPLNDPYCSASWRVHPNLINKLDLSDEEKKLCLELLDEDDYIYPASKVAAFVRDLLNAALGKQGELCSAEVTHSHTIGNGQAVKFRAELLHCFRRERNPIPYYQY